MIPRILVIAGSDSGGGAGIQADIKTITMLGGHAMTAITAITAQNTVGVDAVMPVPVEMVLAQIDACVRDIGVDAVKVGMIGSAGVAAALADALPKVPIVLDPVIVATSGAQLADAATVAAFEQLIARAALTTPNLPELEVLTGTRIADLGGLADAARQLAARIARPVLAKGGHLSGPILTDVLIEDDAERFWEDARIDTRHTHGTGCTLSSAIAVGLGQGMALADAIGRARNYVRAALLAAPGLGQGHGPMGHSLGGVHFNPPRDGEGDRAAGVVEGEPI